MPSTYQSITSNSFIPGIPIQKNWTDWLRPRGLKPGGSSLEQRGSLDLMRITKTPKVRYFEPLSPSLEPRTGLSLKETPTIGR